MIANTRVKWLFGGKLGATFPPQGRWAILCREELAEGVKEAGMKLLIIDNLGAGLGEGLIYEFIRIMAADGNELVLRSTDGTTRIEDMLADAAAFDGVVASGGDGTVAAVCSALRYSDVPILPFPAGTANLCASNLDSPTEVHALANMVRSGLTLDFDLGELEMNGEARRFVIMAGAGFDASIMKTAAPLKKSLGSFAYYRATVNHALPPVARFTIDLDGETIERNGVGILGINFSQLQGGIPVVHGNFPRDGLLDVAILTAANAFELIPALGAAMLDVAGQFPDRTDALEFKRARRVRISCDPELEVEYDGEPIGRASELVMRALPSATRFFVTPETYAAFTA